MKKPETQRTGQASGGEDAVRADCVAPAAVASAGPSPVPYNPVMSGNKPALCANPWILDLHERIPPLRWDEVFPLLVRSVELEIGSGKGMFLRREAAARSDVGFLGVERAGKFFAICAARLARDGRPNARCVRADAHDLLARWVVPGSLGAVHVYFPDPWPKKRHAKRRLLGTALFELAARSLAPGGVLAIATDVSPYFADAVRSLEGNRSFEELPIGAGDREAVATNYALKYAREGRDLNLARFRRSAAPPPPLPPPPTRPHRASSNAPSPASDDSP